MSYENLFRLDLPKWPQLMIVGDPVSEEQARDIILRTDDFLTDPSDYAGGNNKAFNARYRRDSGLKDIADAEEKDDWSFSFDAREHLRARLGYVELSYIHNTWASSSYIGGPYGFCSPDGEIYYGDNIGKYPSVEDVYNEFCLLAKAFPYLNLKASLYNCEATEERSDRAVVVSFVVTCGEVSVTTEDFGLLEFNRPRNMLDMFAGLGRMDREQGLSYTTLLQFHKRVKALIPESIAHAVEMKKLRLKAYRGAQNDKDNG